MDIKQEELDKLNNEPAFGEDEKEEEQVEEEVVEEKVEEKVPASTEEEGAVEVGRIPYSRFEKVNEAKIIAETRLAQLEEQIKNGSKTDSTDITPDEDWIALWGDSEESKKAYLIDQRRSERMRIDATEKILEDIEAKQSKKQEEFQENLNYIEDNIAKFEESIKRKLTDAEESALLDIQDEFTPKDEKGNYIAPLLSPEKAFEIYNLRNVGAKTDKVLARRKVVSITGSGSGDDNSSSSSYDANEWGSWRKKL